VAVQRLELTIERNQLIIEASERGLYVTPNEKKQKANNQIKDDIVKLYDGILEVTLLLLFVVHSRND
jgi:hypothetical protein